MDRDEVRETVGREGVWLIRRICSGGIRTRESIVRASDARLKSQCFSSWSPARVFPLCQGKKTSDTARMFV